MQSIHEKYEVEESDDYEYDFELSFDILGSSQTIKIQDYEQCLKMIGCIAHNYPIKVMLIDFKSISG